MRAAGEGRARGGAPRPDVVDAGVVDVPPLLVEPLLVLVPPFDAVALPAGAAADVELVDDVGVVAVVLVVVVVVALAVVEVAAGFNFACALYSCWNMRWPAFVLESIGSTTYALSRRAPMLNVAPSPQP